MLRRLVLALALCSLSATVAVAGTVYKWSDRSGQVHYTDRPPRDPDAKVIAVIQESNGAAEDEGATESSPAATGEGDAGATSGESANEPAADSTQMRKAVEADVAKSRADQCKKAKERYQSYIDSVRVYREKDGKREYLNQKELDQARVRAAQDVESYCGK